MSTSDSWSKWLAFVSTKSSRPEVYVREAGGPDRDIPVSSQGADSVWWSNNGRELLCGADDVLRSVSFMPGAPPTFRKPVVIQPPDDPSVVFNGFDPAPDGKKFAVGFGKRLPRIADIRVVTDWRR